MWWLLQHYSGSHYGVVTITLQCSDNWNRSFAVYMRKKTGVKLKAVRIMFLILDMICKIVNCVRKNLGCTSITGHVMQSKRSRFSVVIWVILCQSLGCALRKTKDCIFYSQKYCTEGMWCRVFCFWLLYCKICCKDKIDIHMTILSFFLSFFFFFLSLFLQAIKVHTAQVQNK